MISLLLKLLTGLPLLLLVLGAAWVDGPMEQFTSAWLPFLGRLHPVVLHLPIGLLAAVMLLEFPAFFRPSIRRNESLRLLIGATYFGSALAAIFGSLLSWEGGYPADALNWHKWWAVASTVALFFAWIFDRPSGENPRRNVPGLLALGLASLTMVVAGHGGGSLTHGATFLAKYLPVKLPWSEAKPLATPPAALGSTTPVAPIPSTPQAKALAPSVFTEQIQPVLEDYCVQCHGPDKVKGKLRLNSFDLLKAGGENGEVVKAGDSAHSALITRLLLPVDDEDRMPPKGKPQPSPEIIKLLTWWIDHGGADNTTQLANVEVPAELQPLFIKHEELPVRSRADLQSALATDLVPAVFTVRFISLDSASLAISSKRATDEDVERLLPVRGNLTHLDLGRSPLTDRALESISQFTHLENLRLDGIPLTDAGAAKLGSLHKLHSLNLNGTRITDQALLDLRRLKSLKKVYLWDTAVTAEAVEALQKTLYRAAEAERLRLQIADLEHAHDALRVNVVANVTTGPTTTGPTTTEAVAPKETTIADIMNLVHKGKGSKANLAAQGKLSTDDLKELLGLYELMVKMTPPLGSKENFQQLTGKLISSTQGLLAKTPGAEEDFKQALDCKACHSQHRPK